MAEWRLQLIDDSNRGNHSHLRPTDLCAFLREFTSGQGWRGGETNQLVENLKKKRGQGGYGYKPGAIAQCAFEIANVVDKQWLATGTLVPIPPSKMRDDLDYDDRMLQVCRQMAVHAGVQADVRDLLRQTVSTHSFREGARLSVEELAALYEIDEAVATPAPNAIALIDDVLTAGAHFKAAQMVLQRRFPATQIYGVFWARRVFPAPDPAIWLDPGPI